MAGTASGCQPRLVQPALLIPRGADYLIYAKEGIYQLVFFDGDLFETTYQDRAGKYQLQPERVTMVRI
jgi:deoxycytidine triphosphate deaminase